MIDTALSKYQSLITDLSWVGNYGGLTKLVKKAGDSDIQYPVSQNVSFEQCWNGGIYNKLVPDDGANSIVYFEQVGSTTNGEGSNISSRANTYTTPVRMYAWINLNKIGIEHTTDKSPFVNDLLKIFKVAKTGSGARFEVQVTEIESDDVVKEQFSKYNYKNFEKLLYYPYMAITIRMNINQVGDLDCYAAAMTYEDIECKNYAYS